MSNQYYEGGFNKRGNKEGGGNGDAGKIFVGGISRESTEDDLKNYFSTYGKVVECIIKIDPNTGQSRGFGFVSFADPSSVDRVMETKPHILHNKTIDPKRAKSRMGNDECTKVFVGGVDPNLGEDQIREYFGRFGKIENVELPFDREKNARRGFCFVSYDSPDSVETLCSSAKHNVGGREVDVKKATPKGAQQSSRAGSSRGGRGGGRGGGAPDAYGSGGGGWNAPGGYPAPAPQQPYGGGYDYGSYYGQQGPYQGYGQQPQSAYPDPYGQAYAQSGGYDYSAWYGANPGATGQQQQQPQANGVGPFGRGQRAAGENRYQPY